MQKTLAGTQRKVLGERSATQNDGAAANLRVAAAPASVAAAPAIKKPKAVAAQQAPKSPADLFATIKQSVDQILNSPSNKTELGILKEKVNLADSNDLSALLNNLKTACAIARLKGENSSLGKALRVLLTSDICSQACLALGWEKEFNRAENLQAERQPLEQKVVDLAQAQYRLTQEKNDLQNQLDEMAKQIVSLNEEKALNLSRIQELEGRAQVLAAITERSEKQEFELRALRAEAESHKSKIQVIESEKNRLADRIKQLELDLAKARSDADAKDKKVEELYEKNNKLVAQIERMKGRLEGAGMLEKSMLDKTREDKNEVSRAGDLNVTYGRGLNNNRGVPFFTQQAVAARVVASMRIGDVSQAQAGNVTLSNNVTQGAKKEFNSAAAFKYFNNVCQSILQELYGFINSSKNVDQIQMARQCVENQLEAVAKGRKPLDVLNEFKSQEIADSTSALGSKITEILQKLGNVQPNNPPVKDAGTLAKYTTAILFLGIDKYVHSKNNVQELIAKAKQNNSQEKNVDAMAGNAPSEAEGAARPAL